MTFLAPLLRAPDTPHVLRVEGRAAVVATTLEPAFDSATRNRGLLGRSHFAEGSAILLAPCFAVHTFFMRMPIDVVFVSRAGDVLKICPRLAPWRIGVALGAHAVVELPEGTVERTGLVRGDRLALTRAG